MHLSKASPGMLSKCCVGGLLSPYHDYSALYQRFRLSPLPPYLMSLMMRRTAHFSPLSSAYNNYHVLAVTMIENYKGIGGFEKRMGSHSVTMCGRNHHMFKNNLTTDPTGGMNDIILDSNADNAFITFQQQHGDNNNDPRIITTRMETNVLHNLKTELNAINPYYKELSHISRELHTMVPNTDIVATLQNGLDHFDVRFYI